MYLENEPVMKRNEAVLNDLPGKLYTIKANDKIPDNCKYPLLIIQATQNQKQTNTGLAMDKHEILVILNLLKTVFVKDMRICKVFR